MEADSCRLETTSGFDVPVAGTTSIAGVMASRGLAKDREEIRPSITDMWPSSGARGNGVSGDRFALLFVL